MSVHGPNNSHDTDQGKVIGNQADKMHAQWQARPSKNKFKRKFSYTRKTDKRPQQSNLVETKNPQKGQNKQPAVLMFEKDNGKSADLTNEMENFNYEQHSLIDKNEFDNSLSDLDPDFI